MLRTHTCGELKKENVGEKVKLCGWVDTIREHGKVAFVDLRDRYGKIQIVIVGGHELKVGYCVKIEGEVKERKAGTENKELRTGEIEVKSDGIEIFNKSPPMPFDLDDEKVSEDVRLKYRYLDLRSEKMQKNLILRHKIITAIQEYTDEKGFINIETPILAKSTPEGARDYIVPSRVHAGKFYALPQSPQLFKQLSMIAGYDKYYQIARCFRDEDLRADRQPEFTQLDIEMSFIEEEDLMRELEGLWKFVFKKVAGVELKIPFPRITYEEAMKKYGKDNPDVREKGERFAFVWVVDFPSFEYDKAEGRWYAMHHPFTAPKEILNDVGEIKARAYDLVLNGSEIGGGSIRIHDSETQQKVFEILGINKKEAHEKFGFLLDALAHGAPPHGGIAFGLDRVVQLIAGADNIRDVIAFPKNKAAQDVMLDAPNEISDAQLKEVHVKTIAEKKGKK